MPEQRNKKILDNVREITHKDIMTILREIDKEFLKETVSGEPFKKYFFENSKSAEITDYIRNILTE